MNPLPRHQCFMYEGAPSVYLTPVAKVIREKLAANWRCMYMNNAAMVAGMQTCLEANGVDVEAEVGRGSLLFISQPGHLVDGRFDVKKMIETLSDSLDRTLRDGFQGLFCTGDMTWEFGATGDFTKLMEYELEVENFLQAHPRFSAICQYHASSLPAEVLRHGMASHPALFINETLSLINPQFVRSRTKNESNGVGPAGPTA